MSRYFNILIIVILCLLLSAALFLLNDINLDIRLTELKQYLQSSNEDESSSINHLDLVMKYRISTMMYDESISIDEADILENRINLMVSNKDLDEIIKSNKYDEMRKPALFLINTNRSLMGKPPISTDLNKKSVANIEIAYFYERNNHYKKAIHYYDKALKTGIPKGQTLASIKLHQGFCNSLIGKYKPAKKSYTEIIKENSGETISVTATILLNYLAGFQVEYKKLLKSKNSVEKSVKLYNLMAYRESLEVLRKVERRASPRDREKIKYYKALCLRETGKIKRSVNTFVDIISKNPNSKYARYANRKIYIIGSRLGKDNKLKKLAVKTNSVIRDKIFDRMVNEESRVRSSNTGKLVPEINSDNVQIQKDDSGLKNVTISKSLLKQVDEKELLKKMMKSTGLENIGLSEHTQKRVIIIDKTGNIFVGMAKKGERDSVLIDTDIGTVNIERNQIKYIKMFGSFRIE